MIDMIWWLRSSILALKKWKILTLPYFCDSRFSSIPLAIDTPTIAHVPDDQQDWLSLSSCSFLTILLCVSLGCSLVLSQSFILFVSFNNNIFLWWRVVRSVLKVFFVFLFRDSFQLLVDVSIHSVYIIGIWVTGYPCKLRISPSGGTFLFSSLWE